MKELVCLRWLGVLIALFSATYFQSCDSATLKELSGGLEAWRARFAAKGWAKNVYSKISKGKKYLSVTGQVTTYSDGSKVYSVQCHTTPNIKGYTNHISWVAGLLISWHQTKDDVKKLIAGNFDTRQEIYGFQSIQWVPRINFKNFPILQSSIDTHSAWMTLKRRRAFERDKFVLNLPVNECEKITGVFECEAFGHPRPGQGGRYYHASDFYSFSEGDNALDMKCAEKKKRKTEKERKAIENFSKKKLTLSEDYRSMTEDARFKTLRMGWNSPSKISRTLGDMSAVSASGLQIIHRSKQFLKGHFIQQNTLKRRAEWIHVYSKLIKEKEYTVLELTGRVSKKHRKEVTSISRFYVFYEPRNVGLRSVQYLLVGLVRDEAMWAEPYNFRNFPLLQRAINDKNATGVSGSGHAAKFVVRIKYKNCETLPGKFFFEVVGKVPNVKSVVEGFYEIPNDSPLSKTPKSCLYQKAKPKKDDDKDDNEDKDDDKDTKPDKVVTKTKAVNRDKVEVKKANKPEPDSSDNTLLIVVIVVLCIVIMTVAAVCILKARKKASEGEESQALLTEKEENTDDVSKLEDEKKSRKKRRKKKRRASDKDGKKKKDSQDPEGEKMEEQEKNEDVESKNNSNVYCHFKRPIICRRQYTVPQNYARSREVLNWYRKTPSHMMYSYPQQNYGRPQSLVPVTRPSCISSCDNYMYMRQSAGHNDIPVNNYRRHSMYADHEVDLIKPMLPSQPTYVTPRHKLSHATPSMFHHQFPKNFTPNYEVRHTCMSNNQQSNTGKYLDGQSPKQHSLIQLEADDKKPSERKSDLPAVMDFQKSKIQVVPKNLDKQNKSEKPQSSSTVTFYNTEVISGRHGEEKAPTYSEKPLDTKRHGETSLSQNVDPNLSSSLVKRRLLFAPSSVSTAIQDLDMNGIASEDTKSKSASE